MKKARLDKYNQNVTNTNFFAFSIMLLNIYFEQHTWS